VIAPLIRWFDELGSADSASAGGKGANLGELTHAGFPVPPGFVVTADAFVDAMDEGGVRAELHSEFFDATAGPATANWTPLEVGWRTEDIVHHGWWLHDNGRVVAVVTDPPSDQPIAASVRR
jgi:hypothetical protein